MPGPSSWRPVFDRLAGDSHFIVADDVERAGRRGVTRLGRSVFGAGRTASVTSLRHPSSGPTPQTWLAMTRPR